MGEAPSLLVRSLYDSEKMMWINVRSLFDIWCQTVFPKSILEPIYSDVFWFWHNTFDSQWEAAVWTMKNPLFQILLHIFDHKSVVLSNVSGSRCKVAALESNWWYQSCSWLTVDIITHLISIVTLCLQVWLWESWHWTPYRLICGQYDIKLWMLDISGAPHVGEQTNMASSSKSFRSFVIEPRARCLSETSPSWTTIRGVHT